ncbi:MAG: hypothetical protein JWO94_3136 [Verrucomicrobiaceae bacterium]|nr:hypothetical protein [Verrucomicrobiaceae bacterium]
MIDAPEAQQNALTPEGSPVWGLGQRTVALVKAKPLMANAMLFVAGYYLMPNGWLQLCWLLGLLMIQACALKVPDLLLGLRQDRWIKATVGYLVFGVLGSLLVNSQEASLPAVVSWTGGGALLALFLLMMWQVGRDASMSRLMGQIIAGTGSVAAIGSVVFFYLVEPGGLIGDRLQNWFVYGGLHPVCAGLMWGFAATWAACRWGEARRGNEKRWWLAALLVLTAATLLTLSRGALLSLGAGHAALFLVRGWRKAWRPCAILAGMILAFQLSAPLVTRLADFQESLKTGDVIGRDHARQELGEVVVTHNPVKELCQRGDNGRLELYRHVLAAMTGTADVVFGKGLWASDRAWQAGMSWAPEHMHSIFVSTFYHHGGLGLLGLLGLLGWGLWRCGVASRSGQDLWLVLACYGVMALTFDGHSMQTLISVPRFEALLLWLPLVMGCAASSRQAEN